MANKGKDGRGVVLDVTDEIIDKAVRADSASCVIADAIKRTFPDVRGVSVDLATIRWTDPAAGRRYVYLTPDVAQMTIYAFDRGVRPSAQRIRLRRPIQIATVKARSKAQRRDRKERLADLEAKAKRAPDTMTRGDKMALTKLRTTAERPTTQGPRTVDDDGTILGGDVMRSTPAIAPRRRGGRGAPAESLPSRSRTFGARRANPSALDDLLEQAREAGRQEATTTEGVSE